MPFSDLLAGIDPDTKVPLYDGSLFFPTMDQLFQILNLPGSVWGLYEELKPEGAPSGKTMQKLADRRSSEGNKVRPSTFAKMDFLFSNQPDGLQVLNELIAKGACWPQHDQWRYLIAGGLLSQSASRDYWAQQLEASWNLWCVDMRAVTCPVERWRTMAQSPLSKEIGCGLTQQRLVDYIESEPSVEELTSSVELRGHMAASLVTTLLRLAAWMAADWFEYHWENVVNLDDEDRIFMHFLLPRLNPESLELSCPFETCINHMAKITSCESAASSSHLGQLWADFEFDRDIDQGSDNSVDSKQRLIRQWLKGNKGRPDTKSVMALNRAVINKATTDAGLDPDNQDAPLHLLNCGFIFSESCRYLIKDLRKLGLQPDAIEAIFATYEQEYKKARNAFGRPLPDSGIAST